MNITQKKLDGGKVELSIEVSDAEVQPHLEKAGQRLAHKHQIPGFRPGKAPLKVIQQKVGDMAVYDEALQDIITQTLYQALQQEKIDSVGQPEISVDKVAPGNPIVYTAVVALLPEVTLGKWKDVSVKKQEVKIDEADVDKMVEELREMQAKESAVTREAKKDDKVEVNFQVKRDGVVIDGGTGTKYPVVLGKGSMIPGFEDNIIGMKPGEKKTFKLKFPEPYMNEQLAGKEAEFEVELVSVLERTLPETTDEWAQSVIGKSYKEMRDMLSDNLRQDKEARMRHDLEQELMEKVTATASFSELPDILLQNETMKMISELQQDIARRGMKWDQYLQSIKKTKEELEKEFKPHAEKRVKSALVLRKLGEDLNMEATKEEIDAEIEGQKAQYQNNPEAIKQIESAQYRDYLQRILINRKTIDNLISLLVK